MKKRLLAIGLSVVVLACSNSGTKDSTASDTGAHSGPHAAHTGPESPATIETTSAQGQSMMGLMHANMNQMKAVPSTGNPDTDFATLMKVHHQGAVDMAHLLLAKGTDPKLKQMAQRMITSQQNEIAAFSNILNSNLPTNSSGDDFYKETMKGMDNMHMDMDQSGSVDKQFVQMMIPHHQGAIDMSGTYLKSGAKNNQLKKMATAIIADQQKEITEMQAWLNNNK
jgi:uncharacterized protein (DUF305 family)